MSGLKVKNEIKLSLSEQAVIIQKYICIDNRPIFCVSSKLPKTKS